MGGMTEKSQTTQRFDGGGCQQNGSTSPASKEKDITREASLFQDRRFSFMGGGGRIMGGGMGPGKAFKC